MAPLAPPRDPPLELKPVYLRLQQQQCAFQDVLAAIQFVVLQGLVPKKHRRCRQFLSPNTPPTVQWARSHRANFPHFLNEFSSFSFF